MTQERKGKERKGRHPPTHAFLRCERGGVMEGVTADHETQLLVHAGPPSTDTDGDDGVGFTDLRGRRVETASTGGWAASLMIIGMEVAERTVYYGISSNLISYLTEVMNLSILSAAQSINVWSATASMLPLLGAFIADSYLGRFWTILFSSLLYLLGLISLTLAASIPSLRPGACDMTADFCPKATAFQLAFLFSSLYLVALGQGGHKPCLQAFGADQFDDNDNKEKRFKSSFFNWWYFGMCCGMLLSINALVYVQENLSWGLGFAIPTTLMAIALGSFLLGTKLYRHRIPKCSPFSQIAQVLVAAVRKWRVTSQQLQQSHTSLIKDEYIGNNVVKYPGIINHQLRFLDKATIVVDEDYNANIKWRICTTKQVEEVRLVLRLFPIWASCLAYGVFFHQSPTFFIKQAKTIDRTIVSGFEIPAASLQSFITLAIVLLLPVYDRLFVPLARKLSGHERGITLLQRIGCGLFISILCMTFAALVEMKRLRIVKQFGLEDNPEEVVPMNIGWLIPQFFLMGVSDVFTMVGLQEFFYDQIPDTMKSMGIALYLSCIGVGGFLASFLIWAIEFFTTKLGSQSWFANNLNQAHLDYFYWVIVALNAIFFSLFVCFSCHFTYKQAEKGDKTAEESC